MIHRAYIGVGSNLGSPAENCARAINMLRGHPDCVLAASSSFYKTEPVGMEDQSWFVNAVVAVDTALEPLRLLRILLAIEKDMGRKRGEKWGPRLIDLDMLFYDDHIIRHPQLEIPHPEITRRKFVLAPLAEIAGEFIHPKEKKSIRDLLRDTGDDKEVTVLTSSS